MAGRLGHREPSALGPGLTFVEDRSQVCTGSAPQVMAALRNLTISVIRVAGETNIVAALRRHAVHPSRPLPLIGALGK